MLPIVLASESPRRKELLFALGFEVITLVHDIDETDFDHQVPAARVLTLARAKARSALRLRPPSGCAIVGADTLVCDPQPFTSDEKAFRDESGSISLGKPADRDEARNMLRVLGGRTHAVHTGITVIDTASGREESGLSTSFVRFASLSEAEIEDYLDRGEWQGVAGAYRIQGLAALFVEEIRGSWSGIVGLPIHELYAILTRLSITTPALSSGKFPLSGAR
jgi:septum formation protein